MNVHTSCVQDEILGSIMWPHIDKPNIQFNCKVMANYTANAQNPVVLNDDNDVQSDKADVSKIWAAGCLGASSTKQRSALSPYFF